ncbi:hypothetical protein N431DRAFT_506548, partial [Stipitochalara longipes BDJ]
IEKIFLLPPSYFGFRWQGYEPHIFVHIAESIVGDITLMDPVPKSEKNRREVITIDFLAKKVLAKIPGYSIAELEAI